jgi:excisionase family DNA binding protein
MNKRNDSTPNDWITTAKAADITGYHVVHIRRLVREGQIVGKKFGRDWMVGRESVKIYANRMKELGPAKHAPWRVDEREKVKPKG